MAVTVGDQVPDVDLRVLDTTGTPTTVRTKEVLGSGRVVLFAVPGAFTPGCSKQHLPGFVQRAQELQAKGVDTIACVAVNDPWVLDAWAQAHGVGEQIRMLSDGLGEFTRAMGLEFDASDFGLGLRSQRYAAVLEDGVITHLDVDAGGAVELSSCEAVLTRL